MARTRMVSPVSRVDILWLLLGTVLSGCLVIEPLDDPKGFAQAMAGASSTHPKPTSSAAAGRSSAEAGTPAVNEQSVAVGGTSGVSSATTSPIPGGGAGNAGAETTVASPSAGHSSKESAAGGAAVTAGTGATAASTVAAGGMTKTVMTGTGGTSFDCSASNVFCDDFETNDLAANWSDGLKDNLPPGGIGVVDTPPANEVHSGKALHVHFNWTEVFAATLEKRLEGDLRLASGRTLEVQLDFRFAGSSEVYPFGLICDGYELSFNPHTNQVGEKGELVPGHTYKFPSAPQIMEEPSYCESWRTIRWFLDGRPCNPTVSMSIVQPSGDFIALQGAVLDGVVFGSSCRFVVGVYYAGAGREVPEWDGYFDNVRIRVN